MKNKTALLTLIGVLIMSSSCTKTEKADFTKLVFNYSFDDLSNNQVVEEVSNTKCDLNYVYKNAAYKSNSNVPNVEGIKGKAIDFDGNSVSFEGPSVSHSDNFTISFYVAPRGYERNDGQYTSLMTNLSNGGGIDIAMAQYGYWKVTIATTKGNFSAVMSDTNAIPLYDWSHIAIRYFKSSSLLEVYLNGNKANSLSLKGGQYIPSKDKLIVGKSLACTELSVYQLNHFNGLMDELNMYEGALSENKIRELASLATQSNRSNGIVPSYELLSDDRYAPQYHMRNPRAWANEFYGGLYYKGKYHIFSQHNPFRAYYQNGQRWGHLVSEDLVHWEALTPVLTPSNNHIDNSQTFSGSCILDKKGNPLMFYTGVNEGNEYFNSISFAKPDNLNDANLTTWNKSNKKIINQGSNSNKYEFRDPFIYKEDGKYFMLIGGNNSPINGNDGAIFTYIATDDSLENWSYLGICYSGSTSSYPDVLGSTYELPNLFKLTNKSKTISKYMLMISPIYGNSNNVTYWIGSFDTNTGKFTPDNPTPRRYDLGSISSVLAASGFYDENKDRNLFTTMVRPCISDADSYLCGWNDCQTLWKEIYLDDDGNVQITPIEEYDSLAKEQLLNFPTANLSLSQANSLLNNIHSDQYKLELEINLNGDTKVGAYVKYNASKGEQILISYDLNSSTFSADTSKSSLLLKNLPSGSGIQKINGNVKFTIYVDRSMVEAYLNDINEITTMAWNKYKESNSIKLYGNGGKAIITKLKISTLTDAYGCSNDAYWED